MPSLPDIPGKNLVTDTTKRARVIAGAAGAGAVAVGGLVAKRVLGNHGDKEADASVDSDPIAQTPTAPPNAVEKPTPPTKAAAPKPAAAPKAKSATKPAAPKADAKPKAKTEAKAPAAKPTAKAKAAPKPPESKPAPKAKAAPKPKPAKAKAKASAKPPKTTGTDAPPKPSVEPGNISGDKEPHHALNNPVVDPDETEYPDPFEKRADPRDPADPDGEPFGEEPHPATGSESTSEPPLSQDPAVSDGGKPPKREKLDD
jgi:hypothetical protein